MRIQRIQETIQDSLKYETLSCIYTEASGKSLLKITFKSSGDYENFLSDFSIPKRCDKSGILEFPETKTIILTGSALYDFLQVCSS